MRLTTQLFCKKSTLAAIINLGLFDFALAEDFIIDNSTAVTQNLSDGDSLTINKAGSIKVSSGAAIKTNGASSIVNNGLISGDTGIITEIVSVDPSSLYKLTVINGATGTINAKKVISGSPLKDLNFVNDGRVNGNIIVGSIANELNFKNNNIFNGTVNLGGKKVFFTNNGTVVAPSSVLSINSKEGTIVIDNKGSIKNTQSSDDSKLGAINIDGTATINNYGTIDGGGVNSFSIASVSANKQTVNIYSGSKINGFIDLSADANQDAIIDKKGDAIVQDSVNIYDNGSKGSYKIAINHQKTTDINIDQKSNALRLSDEGNTAFVTVVNATGEAARAVRLDALTRNLHRVVSSHLQRQGDDSVKPAMLESNPETNYKSNDGHLWGRVFGERLDRDGEGALSGYKNKLSGFVGGYQYDVNKGQLGILAGFSRAEFTSDYQDDDSNSFYIGVYGQRNFGAVNLAASLITGHEYHNNHRKVAVGATSETAKGENHSYFVSPAVTLYRAFDLDDKFTLRPSALLAYSVGSYDNYQESGVSDNITFDSHSVDSALAQLQLELAYRVGLGEISFAVGVQSHHGDNDDIDMSIAGSRFKYKSAIDSTTLGGYVGVGANIDLQNNLNLAVDARYGGFSGDEHQMGAQVSLQYNF